MSFRSDVLRSPRPDSLETFKLPRREKFFPSPADWRDEVIYFLLPDRFCDGVETTRPLLDRNNLPGARPAGCRFNEWSDSGDKRWQGGTLKGIESKLDYLKGLAITCLGIGLVYKQRRGLNTYHGYGIQDFLEVDSHFGTRQDLVTLVDAAHAKGLRVILDRIFNHSGHNWDYVNGVDPGYLAWPSHHQKGPWIDSAENSVATLGCPNDAVWPKESRNDEYYTRAG